MFLKVKKIPGKNLKSQKNDSGHSRIFEKYKTLVSKEELSDEEYEEIDQLEYYPGEIPDYLTKGSKRFLLH